MESDFYSMSTSPLIDKYSPVKYLSENQLTYSWLVTNSDTEKEYFVKFLNTESEIDLDLKRTALLDSFKLQQRIKNSSVVTAYRKHTSRDIVIIEYPVLASKEWIQLSEDVFWQTFPASLISICQIIDYIHLLKLVHCDLKISNFLVHRKTGEIRLADLDFLKEVGTPLKAMIMGTQDHIAPEVFLNQPATIMSDNFAIGRLLEKCLKSKPGELAADYLADMVTSLTNDHPHMRPIILLDMLHEYEVVSPDQFEQLNRKLLFRQLMANTLSSLNTLYRPVDNLIDFLTRDNNLLGLPSEFIDDLAKFSTIDRKGAFNLLSDMISHSKITRHVDYWHVTIEDKQLIDAYSTIQPTLFPRDPGNRQNKTILCHIKRSNTFEADKQPLKAYLLLCWINLHIAEDQLKDETKILLYGKLAQFCVSQSKVSQAIPLAITSLNAFKDFDEEYFRQIKFLIMQYLSLIDYDKVREYLRIGLEKSVNNPSWQYEFLRLQYWTDMMVEQSDDVVNSFFTLLESAQKQNLFPVIISIYNSIGAFYWWRGDFRNAETNYKAAIDLAREKDMMERSISPLTNLASVYFELSEYEKAIKYAKEVKKICELTDDFPRFQGILSIIVACYNRLCDYNRAIFWHNELRAHKTDSIFDIIRIYSSISIIEYLQGNYDISEEYCHKLIHLSKSVTYGKTIGKAYYRLAEISMIRGQEDSCLEYKNRALEYFQSDKDKSSISDLELIQLTLNFTLRNENRCAELRKLTNSFFNNGSMYSTYHALIYLMIQADGFDVSGIQDEIVSRIDSFGKSKVPLFKCLYILRSIYDGSVDETGGYKEIYREFHGAGEYLLAILFCKKLSEIYEQNAQTRLAIKYLNQSISIAEKIPNRILIERFRKEVSKLTAADSILEGRIDSLYKVSSVLNNVTDYETALIDILSFAVNEAGAERGALLLYSGDSSLLTIKAYINCDNQSLSDISNLSKSIPQMAAASNDPVIVSNALSDNRTKDFKSVILHNIQSVLCVPITYNKKVLGVLYLDHYTIPALFTEEDISFVSALSNFIGLLLTLAQKFNIIQITNDQLINDLNATGARHKFITNDAVLLELFRKLPDIACTNANVLIKGESGTGKEILCEMIHKMSLRSNRQLVKINCASLPKDIIEAELFGIEKGVATGVNKRIGKFSASDSGTLFMDEIGDMPYPLQTKLLRVIEYQKFEMVGSHKTISTDIRFIYATNKNLQQLIKDRKFSNDLFYRINTITIEIPPLRDRIDDIPLLIAHFSKPYLSEGQVLNISEKAMQALLSYSWPGNARELKNIVERMCILYKSEEIKVTNLPPEILDSPPIEHSSKKLSAEVEKAKIQNALIKCGWIQSKAAKSIDMPLTTLRRKQKKYGISRL